MQRHKAQYHILLCTLFCGALFCFCFLKQHLAVYSQAVLKLIILQFSILLFTVVVVWIIFTKFWHLCQRTEEAHTNGKATKDCIQRQSTRGDKLQGSQGPQQIAQGPRLPLLTSFCGFRERKSWFLGMRYGWFNVLIDRLEFYKPFVHIFPMLHLILNVHSSKIVSRGFSLKVCQRTVDLTKGR